MNCDEARIILERELQRYSELPWDEAAIAVVENRIDDFEIRGDSGRLYQIEINFLWDDEEKERIRILGMIDDGGLKAFSSIGSDLFLSKPQAE